MADSPDFKNPLYGLMIGSIVDANGKFNGPVISDGITKLISQKYGSFVISGQSHYVYSDRMNQGSVSAAGSYGVDGLAKFSAAVSAYVGNSSSSSKTATAVTYEALAVGGLQYINFNDIDTGALVASLNKNTNTGITNVLNAFLAVENERATAGLNEEQMLENFASEDPAYPHLKQLVQSWIDASNMFTDNNGTGVVVGVLWGGYGVASMEITSGKSQQQWKYGGSGQFSYAGVGGSFTVKATYDGSQSDASSDVDVSISSSYYGECMKDIVKNWTDTLHGQSWKQLADSYVKDTVPSLNGGIVPPDAPARVVPVADKGIADKIGQVTDMKGLKLYAKAAAFDKKRKDDKDYTLDKFLEDLKKPAADIAVVAQQQAAVAKQDTDPLKKPEPPKPDNSGSSNSNSNNGKTLPAPVSNANQAPANAALRQTNGQLHSAVENKTAGPVAFAKSSDDDYIPMGIWIADWANLFPWLATGFLNSISDDSLTGALIKARTMIQDLSTLSRLYFGVYQAGLGLGVDIDVKQIADSFINTSAIMTNGFMDARTDASALYDLIDSCFANLSNNAQSIYKTWIQNYYLRNCELGMGLIFGCSPDTNNLPDVSGMSITWPGSPLNNNSAFSLHKCDFNSKNFAAFSGFVKGYPVITPAGDIYMMVNGTTLPANGSGTDFAGYLKKIDNGDFRLCMILPQKEADYSQVMQFRKDKDYLWRSDKDVAMAGTIGVESGSDPKMSWQNWYVIGFPIPFEAAQGISDWRGPSMSTNLKAFDGLQDALGKLQKKLSGLPVWSFSSDNWNNRNASGYGIRTLLVNYLGLVPEMGNIFSVSK